MPRFLKKRGFFPSFLLFILLTSSIYAYDFVYAPAGIMQQKTIEKINLISSELYEKTQTGIFIAAVKDLPKDSSLEAFESNMMENLPESYVFIVFVKDIKKIDVKVSKDLETMVDANRIFWDYMVPLIPQKDRELTPERISGIVFNGYLDAAQQVSDGKDVAIKELPAPESEMVGNIAQYLFYFFAGSLFLILAYSYIRGNKSE